MAEENAEPYSLYFWGSDLVQVACMSGYHRLVGSFEEFRKVLSGSLKLALHQLSCS